ncbi:hypothetical protein TcasGA2_TC003261 [Tribolium castaneum]|uniref:Uncharacterized protein n=1 Tax=Tribolium castaneum TaxID=7070 RepID=D6WEH0_TRICA|nr:hypothetical protein TcasGA2_TC003261 [Tribolium castaneum]
MAGRQYINICNGSDQSMIDQEDSVDRKCSAAPAEHEAPAGMAGSNIASGGSSKGRGGSYPLQRHHLYKGCSSFHHHGQLFDRRKRDKSFDSELSLLKAFLQIVYFV